MIDETDVVALFHKAFAVEVPPGAAPRLRAILREGLDAPAGRLEGRLRYGLTISVRLVAGLTLVALTVALAAALFVAHRATTPPEPANAPPFFHALAGPAYDPRMVSPTIGWWTPLGGPVLRTIDGGASWYQVGPPNNMSGPETGYFIDATHGWLVYGSPHITTYRTADGGRTWSALSSGAGSFYSGWLFFIDQRYGWLMASQGLGGDEVLFRTQDGGAHWAVATRWPSDGGCGGPNGMAFTSSTFGWISILCLNGDLAIVSETIMVTHDGGSTWSAAGPPLNAVTPACSPCLFDVPIVLDRQHAVVVVSAISDAPASPVYLLVTSDGGTTWSARSLPGKSPSSVQFVDAQNGWTIADSGDPWLYRTSDGGVTWMPVRSKLVAGAGARELRNVYFVDSNNGFAIRVYSRVDLLKTTDGGQTWVFLAVLNNNPCVRLTPTNYCPA